MMKGRRGLVDRVTVLELSVSSSCIRLLSHSSLSPRRDFKTPTRLSHRVDYFTETTVLTFRWSILRE